MINSALWYHQFGAPAEVLTLENAPMPVAAADKIRIAMISTPINPSDLIPITGAYRHRLQPPLVAGYEGLGRVISTTGAWKAFNGRRVLPLRADGTWQRFLDIDPRWLVWVPEDVTDDIAARGYINPLAAMLMLKQVAVRGAKVLVSGAGSQCAGLIAQWALMQGAREVVGIYRSPIHRSGLVQLGITPVASMDIDGINAAAAGSQVVFDAVGGPQGTAMLAAASPATVFVSYGLLSGRPLRIAPGGCLPRRFHLRDQLVGVTPETWQHWFQTLWPLLCHTRLGGLNRFPLDRWRDALAYFGTPGRTDKPLLVMPNH
ncbi:MDR/zinc-dependent alcohol dehydrogenase-like family protein [Biostraticola tofi]|uniref:NADPH:quinone reductase-like Zn-dependent oxidoreductase n=1 Tax=Biostraticola tofi TaxID=466109 RepID=A0A4V2W3K0_9GAMM|nr:alcohol dehydrogenase [Biostraticola tofi]TCV92249.1 NADPH:quinone reductase-like Zn-dependent oxidoreductase [Biostraticola tofi]